MIPYGYCHCGCGGKTELFLYGDKKGTCKKFIAGHRSGTLDQKFWAKVSKSNDCWEWQGSINNAGYGQITVGGKCQTAHRFAWQLHHGAVPAEIYVCHKCDNRKCVNPDHLFLGSQSDNMQDRRQKGRQNIAKGGKHHSAKLTDDQVSKIRQLPASEYITAAEEYGVTVRHIVRVANYKARTAIFLP